ncbi:Membrane protein [Vulgatibacter incomptus]|uniref:Membrane protein n=1 Tax=Vulgatibacter incomptus TaxID=1391653 RepID=A0A0K1P8W5_9BACT|nr:Membrane protein [Vulgatibacter incomptus]
MARSAFHLLSGQVATTLLSILLNAKLGRTLGATDFGLYFFLLTSTYFVNVFMEWGQGSILVRDVARRPDSTARFLGSALAIRVALAVPGTIVGTLVVRLLGYDLRTQLLMALTIVAFTPNSLFQTFGLVFRGRERMDLDARATVLNKVLHVGMVLAAFALGGHLLAVIVSLGIAAVITLGYAIAKSRELAFGRLRIEAQAVRHLMSHGTPVLGMAVLAQAQIYIETLLLSALGPAVVLGFYGAARTITNTLIMPASILITASYPRLSRALGDPAAMREEVANALRPVLILGILVASGTALFADVAIGVIYGKEGYGPAVTILQIMSPWLFLVFLNLLFASVLIIQGRATPIAAIRVVIMAAFALLAWHVIPLTEQRWGSAAIGLLAASLLAETVLLAASISLAPRGILSRRSLADLLRALFSAGAATAVVLALPVSTPIVRIPVFLLSFAAAAIACRLLGRADMEILRNALNRTNRL